MTPAKITVRELMSVDKTIKISLTRAVLTPKDLASSSPWLNRLRYGESKDSITMHTSMTGAVRAIVLGSTFESPPISQYTIAGSLSYGSATILITDVNDANSDELIMPPRISMSRASSRRMSATPRAKNTAIIPPKNA